MCSWQDLAAGIRTLASRLGERRSYLFYRALLLLPYLAPIHAALTRSAVAALPLLSLPSARKLVADFRENRMIGLPKRTAKFQFLFGVLLTVGMLVPSPSIGRVGEALVRGVGELGKAWAARGAPQPPLTPPP